MAFLAVQEKFVGKIARYLNWTKQIILVARIHRYIR